MKKVTKLIISDVSNVSRALGCMKELLACMESNDWSAADLDPEAGLCANMDILYGPIGLNEIMECWPNHSGNYKYPVKSGCSYITPKEMYGLSRSNNNLYLGAYGKRRINLLKWLIKEFEIAAKHLNK